MTLALLIGLAGATGSTLRFLVDQLVTSAVRRRTSRPDVLPWATFAINTSGSFALGLLTAAASAGAVDGDVRLVLGVGVCGGYTTFSTAMVDTLRLGLQGRRAWAVVNLVGGIAVATAAAALGWACWA